MNIVTASFVQEFADERQLGKEGLSEQFEAFAAFCVVSEHFDGELDPVEVRTGGGNDLAIDAAALLVNGDLVTTVEEIDDLRTRNNYLQGRIILLQAKTSTKFDSSRVTDLADNICAIFSSELVLPASEAILEFKNLVDALYASSTSFRRGSPDLIVRYVTTGTWTDDAHLVAKLKAAQSRIEALNLFETVSFKCVGAKRL